MKPSLFVLTSTLPRSESDATPRFVLDLSRYLASEFDVTIISPIMTGSRDYEELGGVKIVRYRYWWGSSLLSDFDKLSALKQNPLFILQIIPMMLGQLLTLIRLSRKKQTVAVHAHWLIPSGLVGALFKRFFHGDVRLVITAHGSDVHKLRWADGLKRWVLSNTDVIAPVSVSLAEILAPLRRGGFPPVKVLPMGVNEHRFSPAARDERISARLGAPKAVVLFVGRLEEVKGVQILLMAIPEVLRNHRSVSFAIVGYGSLEPLVQERCAQVGAPEGSVQFLGRAGHEDLPALYASSDIVVVPSLSEGFGLSVIEAMACGCVVVASDLPAIREFVIEGENGFLATPGDPQALAASLGNALEESSQWPSIRDNAREMVLSKFSWTRIAAEYAELISSPSPTKGSE